jgi:hypothetical protein
MEWKKLDERLTKSERYQFFKKYERLITLIEGLIVIGLMIGIINYIVDDREIKTQIRDNCGYTTDTYDCVCDVDYVKTWNDLKTGKITFSNLSMVDG